MWHSYKFTSLVYKIPTDGIFETMGWGYETYWKIGGCVGSGEGYHTKMGGLVIFERCGF
jgi:hypothetical protein